MKMPSSILLVAFCLILATGGTSARSTAEPEPSASVHRPNIVLVLTDDQDLLLDSLEFMPLLQARLADQGMTFSNFFVSQSLCCPSRMTLLRGQYTHNHQVFNNLPPDGGFEKAYALGLENATFATALQGAGYRTTLIGKYLNGYPLASNPTYIPPGWDEWFVPTTNSAYGSYNYTVNDDGVLVTYGGQREDYITDVLTREAISFITRTTTQAPAVPFFVALNFYAPHNPSVPAPRHYNLFPNVKAPRSPSFNEADMSDKPPFMQSWPPLTVDEILTIDRDYRKRLLSLLAVDEAINALVSTLQFVGQLDNTYIVFASDNGYHMGQHRMLQGKAMPYEEDIRVPLIVRGPGVPAGSVRRAMTSMVDLAPTFAEIAGAALPVTPDGRSLLPLLHNLSPAPAWRQMTFVEDYFTTSHAGFDIGGSWEPPDPFDDQAAQFNHQAQPAQPAQPAQLFTALRTPGYIYIKRSTALRELYDLVNDPFQLQNQWENASPGFRSQVEAKLAAYRRCAGASCQTAGAGPPPTYTLNPYRRQFLPQVNR
jgi:N-acetylglucosamine-6-sulfatase